MTRAEVERFFETYRQADHGHADFTLVHHEPLGPQHAFARIAFDEDLQEIENHAAA